MNQPDDVPAGQPKPTAKTSFLRCWSERKQHAREAELRSPQLVEPATTAVRALTDSDMPSLESLDEASDYSVFFSPKVNQELRRQALRKLFHSPGFNNGDGLSDYSEDYSRFEPLGDLVTQELCHRQKVEAAHLGESLLSDRETTPAKPVASQSNEPELPMTGSECTG